MRWCIWWATVKVSGWGKEIPKADMQGMAAHCFTSMNHWQHLHITSALRDKARLKWLIDAIYFHWQWLPTGVWRMGCGYNAIWIYGWWKQQHWALLFNSWRVVARFPGRLLTRISCSMTTRKILDSLIACNHSSLMIPSADRILV